jgi:hypothetical protein
MTPREGAANVIDVHKLAGELGVSSAVILQSVVELGGTVSSGSTLTEDLAGQVRTHLRGAQRGFSGSGGSPMFSVPAQHSVAARREGHTVAPAFPGRDELDRPRQRAQADDPFRVSGTATPGEADRALGANTTSRAEHDALASQLAAQLALSALAEQWRAAGLGPLYQHIVDQCQRHGLTPEDVRRRVDGQTVASRLKNGESISSVRSRIAQSN